MKDCPHLFYWNCCSSPHMIVTLQDGQVAIEFVRGSQRVSQAVNAKWPSTAPSHRSSCSWFFKQPPSPTHPSPPPPSSSRTPLRERATASTSGPHQPTVSYRWNAAAATAASCGSCWAGCASSQGLSWQQEHDIRQLQFGFARFQRKQAEQTHKVLGKKTQSPDVIFGSWSSSQPLQLQQQLSQSTIHTT